MQSHLHRRPALLFAAPAVLSIFFCALAAASGALTAAFALLAAAYLALPTICVFLAGAGPAKRATWADFAAVLLLWLPLEFAAGAPLVPRAAQGFLHSAAYGVAIVLALVLFLGFRALPGMKYRLPEAVRDYWLPLAGFLVCAVILIPLGVGIGFMPAFHAPPAWPAWKFAARFGLILVGTALPEEILFRSLIQNLLSFRLGNGLRNLMVASVIFGCAHLNNGPQPLPNWRYMILATIAGVAYGKVFERSSTVLSSAGLHAMVDAAKHFFF